METFRNWVLSGGEGFCNGGFHSSMSNPCHELYDQYARRKTPVDPRVQIYDECLYGTHDHHDSRGG